MKGGAYCLILAFGKATFPLKVHKLSNGCPSSCSLSLPSRPSVSFCWTSWHWSFSSDSFPCTACRVVLTRLTFLFKVPKQNYVQEILQCHQTSPVWEEMPTPTFPLNVTEYICPHLELPCPLRAM